MTTEFHLTVKRLELFIARQMWEQAARELENAYKLQPDNVYLRAFQQRIEESKVK